MWKGLCEINKIVLSVKCIKKITLSKSCGLNFLTTVENLGLSNGLPWRRQWHPTPVPLPGKSHGQRSLWAAVPGVVKSRTRLSDFTFTFHFHTLENEMATHSSILAWRIPGTGSLVGCRLWGRRVGHDWSDLAAAAAVTDFPGGSDGEASVHNVGDQGLIPGSGRSPGEGYGNPLQYSYLENPMDGRAL